MRTRSDQSIIYFEAFEGSDDNDKDKEKDKEKDKILKRPNMCYVFEKLRFQGYQI